jgi:hypothetical protein
VSEPFDVPGGKGCPDRHHSGHCHCGAYHEHGEACECNVCVMQTMLTRIAELEHAVRHIMDEKCRHRETGLLSEPLDKLYEKLLRR